MLLNAYEPPEKNPIYFGYSLSKKNRNIMIVLFTISSLLIFYLSKYPSNLRGLFVLDCAVIALSVGFLMKYFFLKLGENKKSNWFYNILMDDDLNSSSEDGGSFMFLVMICQLFFFGCITIGLYLLFVDAILLRDVVQYHELICVRTYFFYLYQ